MNFKPQGVIPALVTPLAADYQLNEQALRKLIDYVIDAGVHGIFVSGTAGEFYGLGHEQKQELFRIAVDHTNQRVPVYAGTGAITTPEAIALTRLAQESGIDAVSVLTPMFMSPTQAELITHYQTIAENTDLPILLYNNAPKTGLTLTAATVLELAQIDNIVGVKDSSGDFSLTVETIRRTRDMDFSVLIGRDIQIHACLCYGGAGAIAATANVAPKMCADIYAKHRAGDLAGSLESQLLVVPLRKAFSLGSHPTMLKESLELLGIEAGPCLPPVGPMSGEEKEQLTAVLTELQLI